MEALLSAEVILAASGSALGALCLMVLVLGVVALAFFSGSPTWAKLTIFFAMLLSTYGYSYALIKAESELSSDVIWRVNADECSNINKQYSAKISGDSGELVIQTPGSIGTAEIFCPIEKHAFSAEYVDVVFESAFINWHNSDGSGASTAMKVTSSTLPEASTYVFAEKTIATKIPGASIKRLPTTQVFKKTPLKAVNGIIVSCRSAWTEIPVECSFQELRLIRAQ